MNLTLLDDIDKLQKNVESNFNGSGHLMPVLFLNKAGKIEIYGIVSDGPAWKDTVYEIISKAIQNDGLKEFIFAVEAWMGFGDKAMGHMRGGQSLETFQERKEIVSLQYASPAKEILYYAEILRPEEGRPHLGEWEANETDQQSLVHCVAANTRFNFIWHRLATEQN